MSCYADVYFRSAFTLCRNVFYGFAQDSLYNLLVNTGLFSEFVTVVVASTECYPIFQVDVVAVFSQ